MDLTITWGNDGSYNTVNSCDVHIKPHYESLLNLKLEWRHSQGWSGEINNQFEDGENVIVKRQKQRTKTLFY